MKNILKGIGAVALVCLLATQVFAMGHRPDHKGAEHHKINESSSCPSQKGDAKACPTKQGDASEACCKKSGESCDSTDATDKNNSEACKKDAEACDATKKTCTKTDKSCSKKKNVNYWGTSKVYVKVRPRIESVSADGTEALAGTARVSVGGKLYFPKHDIKAVVEATNVLSYLQDYNSGSAIAGGVNANKATVMDPEQARFTKLYLATKIQDAVVKIGQRPINIDNKRFIGSVNWRQMPQTFSGASVSFKPLKDSKAMIAYLAKRNGIIPENDKKFEKGSLLVHGEYSVLNNLDVQGFAYLLEDIHTTIGVKGKGKLNVGDAKVKYFGTYAIQRTPTLKTDAYTGSQSTSYYAVGAKTKFNDFKVGLQYEAFGAKGSGDNGFSTPYATLHGHNGWSDVMASKAASGDDNGFTDLSVSVGSKSILGKPMITYHSFNSVENGVTYGSEIDLKLKHSISCHSDIVLKAAMFNADAAGGLTSTNKYWLYTSTKF